ncbi:MAG TPA: hypothetical protein VGK73_08740 [Polyangiaceae bacterium]
MNGSPYTGIVTVTPGATVNLALASTFGVSTVQWSVVGNHGPSAVNPTITPAGSPSGVTASFTMPSGGANQSFLIQCRINAGRDKLRRQVPGYFFRALIGTGNLPLCLGEKLERHPVYGWQGRVNDPPAASDADDVSFVPTDTALTSTDTQEALAELGGRATMAALRAIAPVNGKKAVTNCFAEAGDGGGGTWRGVTGAATSTYTHNGGTVIVPSGGNGSAAWLRERPEPYRPEWFGGYTTAGIQAAINAAQAAFEATGKIQRVILGPGTFDLDASAETTPIENDGASVDNDSTCILLYEGVSLIGAGRALTRLRSNDPDVTVLMALARDGGEISGFTVDGQWTDTGAGHGIFTVSYAGDTEPQLRNVRLSNLRAENVGSYGIGLQAGDTDNVTIDDIQIENIGADGLDLKCRGATFEGPALFVSNISVKSHGKRVVGSAGIDVRGRARISSYYCYDCGTDTKEQVGFRFRTKSADDPDAWAQFSTLTDFYIECNNFAGVTALQVGSANCAVSVGVVRGAAVEVGGNAEGTPDNVTLADVTVIDAPGYGFEVSADVNHVTYSGCKAINATTAGFRNEANYTTYIGCSAPGTTTPHSTSSGAAPTEKIIGRTGANWLTESSGSSFAELIAKGDDTNVDVRVSPKGSGSVEMRSRGSRALRATNPAGTLVNWVDVHGSAASSPPDLSAVGSDTNISLLLQPKGTGKVRFGTRTASSDVAITGYVEIEDSGGTIRRLAVID